MVDSHSPSGVPRPRALVAVTTYRRAELLGPLVARIHSQCGAGPGAPRVLVVDNDAGRSAEATAGSLGVDYACVPTPGIAAARQGALDAAEGSDVLVMVDDDVMPEPGWFDELVAVWRDTGATAVMGHVRYVWPDSCDPWLVDTGYMRRTRHPRGHRLSALATSNVLLDMAQVRDLGVGFNLSLGLGGGEDTYFGRDVLARGGTIVAAPDSVVRDDVPSERATLEFARRRAITHGQTRSRFLIDHPSPAVRRLRSARELLGGVVRLVVFTAGAAAVPRRLDRRRNAVLTRRSWFARGRILGALGRSDSLYGRPAAG